MPYLRKNEPTGFWCKWQYFCFFSLFQLYNFIGVRRELKKKNKACRYLESWVCLLSCVKVLRLFLENLDYSVSDAEFKIVFFSTNLPVKTEFFYWDFNGRNHTRSYWNVWIRKLIWIKIHNKSSNFSDNQDSDAETKRDSFWWKKFAASWYFQSSVWWKPPST